MAYDGFVIGALANELDRALAGGRIDKIYQPETDELLLRINNAGSKFHLLLSANGMSPRLHLTDHLPENPEQPPAFCMLLRKLFQNGRILSIRQRSSDRIIDIRISSPDEMGFLIERVLTIEIMGKHSNIIALRPEDSVIIDSIKRITGEINRYRQLLPGLAYVAPPDRGKRSFYNLSPSAIEELLCDEKLKGTPADRLAAVFQGISPAFAATLTRQRTTLADVAVCLADFVKRIESGSVQTGEIEALVYINQDQQPIDFHVFRLPDVEETAQTTRCFASVSHAIDYFFFHQAATGRLRQRGHALNQRVTAQLEKLRLKQQRLSEELLEAESAEHLRLAGELLTAHLHLIDPGAKTAEVPNYYDGTTLTIPLDPRFSPAANAQRYYKKYGKMKTAVREKRVQLEATAEQLDYLESVLIFIEQADSDTELDEIRRELAETGLFPARKAGSAGRTTRERRPSQAFLKYSSPNGLAVLIGRNNLENDRLTFKIAGKTDYWLHAKDIPGSHVLLKTEGSEPAAADLRFAAGLAAYYSKARLSANVPVDYVPIRYVKKPAGAKPGKVIFTHHRTLYVNPLNPSAGLTYDA